MEKALHLGFSLLSTTASLRFHLFKAYILRNAVIACSCVCKASSANATCAKCVKKTRAQDLQNTPWKTAGWPKKKNNNKAPAWTALPCRHYLAVCDIQIVGGLTNRTRQWARNSVPVEISNSSLLAAFLRVRAFLCVTVCEGLRYYCYFKYSLPRGGGIAQGKSRRAAYLSEGKSEPRSTGAGFTRVCTLEVKTKQNKTSKPKDLFQMPPFWRRLKRKDPKLAKCWRMQSDRAQSEPKRSLSVGSEVQCKSLLNRFVLLSNLSTWFLSFLFWSQAGPKGTISDKNQHGAERVISDLGLKMTLRCNRSQRLSGVLWKMHYK